jgi:lipopolysaccharide transport system ATP-binding protein
MFPSTIQVENLSKLYRVGLAERRAETLAGIVAAYVRSPWQNFKRLRALGNVSAAEGDSEDVVWALRDVSFSVREGEVLGIIGANGAGKSTLLKVLAGITEPTVGRATLRGRVASLLEVGTGFHADLTGRENIYLNGTILGMKKAEIDEKFDEIVAFSGVERFIDTPVKRYSSGMTVRLAFAVAAHLQPEILLVDEVLAVGDLRFQEKCIGKMSEVARSGRTVLFVSHNLAAVGSLCKRAILLNNGRIEAEGPADEVISRYASRDVSESSFREEPINAPAYFDGGRIVGGNILEYGGELIVELDVVAREPVTSSIMWRIEDALGVPVACGVPHLQLGKFQELRIGGSTIRIRIAPLPFFEGTYRLSFDLNDQGRMHLQRLEDRLRFSVTACDPASIGASLPSKWGAGSVVIPFDIEVI